MSFHQPISLLFFSVFLTNPLFANTDCEGQFDPPYRKLVIAGSEEAVIKQMIQATTAESAVALYKNAHLTGDANIWASLYLYMDLQLKGKSDAEALEIVVGESFPSLKTVEFLLNAQRAIHATLTNQVSHDEQPNHLFSHIEHRLRDMYPTLFAGLHNQDKLTHILSLFKHNSVFASALYFRTLRDVERFKTRIKLIKIIYDELDELQEIGWERLQLILQNLAKDARVIHDTAVLDYFFKSLFKEHPEFYNLFAFDPLIIPYLLMQRNPDQSLDVIFLLTAIKFKRFTQSPPKTQIAKEKYQQLFAFFDQLKMEDTLLSEIGRVLYTVKGHASVAESAQPTTAKPANIKSGIKVTATSMLDLYREQLEKTTTQALMNRYEHLLKHDLALVLARALHLNKDRAAQFVLILAKHEEFMQAYGAALERNEANLKNRLGKLFVKLENQDPMFRQLRSTITEALIEFFENENHHLLATYIKQGAVPLESYFFQNVLEKDIPYTNPRIGVSLPALQFFQQEIIAAQILLQFIPFNYYENDRGAPNILEIGYNTPSLLNAMVQSLKGSKGFGIDEIPVAPQFEQAAPALTLFQGTLFRDPIAHNAVQKAGPYRLIYALDLYKTTSSFKFRVPFQSPVAHQTYLKGIYDLMEPGGVFIIINDDEADAVFSKNDAKQVGFEIVASNEVREIERQLIPNDTDFFKRYPRYCHLKYSVWRKPLLPVSRN